MDNNPPQIPWHQQGGSGMNIPYDPYGTGQAPRPDGRHHETRQQVSAQLAQTVRGSPAWGLIEQHGFDVMEASEVSTIPDPEALNDLHILTGEAANLPERWINVRDRTLFLNIAEPVSQVRLQLRWNASRQTIAVKMQTTIGVHRYFLNNRNMMSTQQYCEVERFLFPFASQLMGHVGSEIVRLREMGLPI